MAEEEWNDQIALPWNVPIFMRNIINNVDCLNSCDFFFRNIQLLHAKKKCNVLEIFLYRMCAYLRFTYTTWINIERAIGIFRVMALTVE